MQFAALTDPAEVWLWSYYILQLPSVCFALLWRKTGSSVLLYLRYSDATFVVARYHTRMPVAHSLAPS